MFDTMAAHQSTFGFRAVTTASFLLLAMTAPSHAAQNSVSVEKNQGRICISSNAIPNHATGKFPSRANPNAIREQRLRFCVTAAPQKSGRITRLDSGAVGVALNGVPFRPFTAGRYDPNARNGHSQRSNSPWHVEAMGAPGGLGLDTNNAHVDKRGLYHYHGIPKGLLGTVADSIIGYAADGFEIHYVGNAAQSGWQLKSGTRPNGPRGTYDGTYEQDYEFTGAGNLDECNGAMMNGSYVYFATDTYPFVPRCLWGDVSGDFQRGRAQ